MIRSRVCAAASAVIRPLSTERASDLPIRALAACGLLLAAGGEDDLVPGLGEDLGDTGGHRAGAGDTDRADRAAGGPRRRPSSGVSASAHDRGAAGGLVGVEAAARLAAGQARLAELLEDRRGGVQPVVGLGVHRLQDRTGGVDADQVEQRERAHRQTAAEPHRRVDVLAGGVLRLVHRGGLVEVAEQQPVGDEAGPVADRDGLLAEVAGRGR